MSISGFEKEAVGLYAAPKLAPLPQRVLEHLCQVTLIEPPCRQQDDVVAVAFSSRETELAAAAEWAYENSQQANARIAIVLLDLEADRDQLEYRLREQFDCLDAQYNDLPVNFSTGMSLGTTPMYRDLLLALEWETRSLSRAEWLALLRSPFLPFSHEQPQQTLTLIDRSFRRGALRYHGVDAAYERYGHARIDAGDNPAHPPFKSSAARRQKPFRMVGRTARAAQASGNGRQEHHSTRLSTSNLIDSIQV